MTRSAVPCLLLICFGCASDDRRDDRDHDRAGDHRRDSKLVSDADRRATPSGEMFVREAAEDGMTEVELGRMAAAQGQDERVRRFGQRMFDDHGKVNQELRDLARDEGISLPIDPTAKVRSMKDRFSGLSGETFDRRYMEQMVEDHETDVRKFEQEARDNPNPRVRAFADRTLPALREHLREAREIARYLGVSKN